MKTVGEFIEYQEEHYADKSWIIIEFAKYHVKEALKSASINAKVETLSYYDRIVNKSSILNAYPIENIK